MILPIWLHKPGEHTTHKNINIPYGFFYCLISFLPRCRWSPPIYGSSFYAALRPDRRLQRAAAALALEMAAIENKYSHYLVVIWHAMGMARSDKSDAIDTAAC